MKVPVGGYVELEFYVEDNDDVVRLMVERKDSGLRQCLGRINSDGIRLETWVSSRIPLARQDSRPEGPIAIT